MRANLRIVLFYGSHDIRETNVTISSEIQTRNVRSLEFQSDNKEVDIT